MAISSELDDLTDGLPAILALLPESADTFTLDKNLRTPIQTIEKGGDDEFGVTVCPARDGNLWLLYDVDGGTSVLRKVDPTTGEILETVNTEVRIGELGGYKSLMDLSCGELLTVDRDAHQLVAIKVPDPSLTDNLTPSDDSGSPAVEDADPDLGKVMRRYGLIVDPLDAALNSAATRLLYIDGGTVKIWDLETDAFLRAVVTV